MPKRVNGIGESCLCCRQLAAADAGEVSGVFFEGGRHGFVVAEAVGEGFLDVLEDALVVAGHDFDDFWEGGFPVG